ncbi:MFS transporter [Cytobacillus purgationiresistens]|uniref:MFS family permease n=1 Tax=Cytobacillus purgationiresistens TaxID=863449 RepID=A0ABU0AQ19_9BACI|nr:MFS transporter [Cytobacillus purgationiresistens]MDQ0273386.1 MFS family permease [Cytobacillus purgationiresistens]
MNLNIIKLIIVQALSNFASSLLLYFFIFQTMNNTQSAIATGSIGAMAIIPSLILFPFVGYLIDRFSKKKLLICCISIQIIFLTVFLFMEPFFSESLFLINVLIFIVFLFRTFISPIIDTVIPHFVKKEELHKANSNVNIFNTIVDISSPIVASLLFLGQFGLTLLCIVFYVLCLIVTCFLDMSLIKSNPSNMSLIKDILEGYRFIFKSKILLTLVISFSVLNLLIVPLNSVIFPVLSSSFYMEGTLGTGFLISAYSAGFLIGGIVFRLLKISYYNGIISSTAFLVIAFIIYTIHDHIFMGILGAFSSGFAILGIVVYSTSLFQYITPENIRGRVFTARKTLSMSLGPVGIFVFGSLITLYEITTIMLIFCFITIVLLFVIIFITKKKNSNFYGNETSL